jgi:hypothetical protein
MVGIEYVRREYVDAAVTAADFTLSQSRRFWQTLRDLENAERRGFDEGYTGAIADVEQAQECFAPVGNAGETEHEGWYINADGQRCEAW